jgi:hypothetical protein
MKFEINIKVTVSRKACQLGVVAIQLAIAVVELATVLSSL